MTAWIVKKTSKLKFDFFTKKNLITLKILGKAIL